MDCSLDPAVGSAARSLRKPFSRGPWPSHWPSHRALVCGLLVLLLGMMVGAAPVRALGPPVVVGDPVQFLDRSIFGPESWAWDFDYDGVKPTIDSVEQNPVWIFQQARIHRVYLEVCSPLGCDSVVRDVEVLLPPPLFLDDFETGDVSRWSASLP